MKKSNTLIIIIIFLSLVILSLVGYILYSHKLIDDSNKNDKVKDNEKFVDNVNISSDEASLMKLVSTNTFVISKDKFNKSDLDGEDFIYTLVNLSGKDITEVTGSELKNISLKYFNKSDVDFVSIKCFMANKDSIHIGDSQYMLKYNSNTDKYEWNENHPGHGGNGTGYGYYLGEKDYSYKDGKYYYDMDVFYYNNGCIGDTCGPNSSYDVYLSYTDLVNNTNRYINAVSNDKYCVTVEDGLYNCNNDSIYMGIKDKLHHITFVFTKENDNLIFDSYKYN